MHCFPLRSIENLYHLQHSNIARVGEDFYPLQAASNTAHIANAAFCTLFVGAIAFPDWDMFQSVHGAAALHAAARVVSGGMVYVSDRVGEHDFELLRRLVLPDGSVLRCLLPGRPTADCLFQDVSRNKRTVLKVSTRLFIACMHWGCRRPVPRQTRLFTAKLVCCPMQREQPPV